MRLKLISCEVLRRELGAAISRSPHQIDAGFLPMSLHDLGGQLMRGHIQRLIDALDPSRYDAIVLGYARCGNMIVGLEARRIPVVIPRAHDCIGLLMGSRQRYQDYFNAHSGVYFRSPGWLKQAGAVSLPGFREVSCQQGMRTNLDELIARYGVENGRYLYEQLTGPLKTYQQITYIRTGVEPDQSIERAALSEAEQRGWRFEVLEGSLALLERLVNGDWDSADFLVVPPGAAVRATIDDSIVKAV